MLDIRSNALDHETSVLAILPYRWSTKKTKSNSDGYMIELPSKMTSMRPWNYLISAPLSTSLSLSNSYFMKRKLHKTTKGLQRKMVKWREGFCIPESTAAMVKYGRVCDIDGV